MSSYLVNPVTRKTFPLQSAPNGTLIRLGSIGEVPTSAGAATVQAPVQSSNGQVFGVVDRDNQAATNPITVSGNGNTIDGASSVILAANGVEAFFVWDVTEWKRVLVGRLFEDDQPEPFVRFGSLAGAVPPPPTVRFNWIELGPFGSTFPTSGLVRSAFFAGAQALWQGRPTAGSEERILSQTATQLVFGHNANWGLQIEGDPLALWGRTAFDFFGGAGVNIGRATIVGWHFGEGAPSFGSGVQVIGRRNATTIPTTNPTNGIVDYVDGADESLPKTRLPSGIVLVHAGVDPSANGMRLSLATNDPVPIADLTGNTLFLTPHASGAIALYDGSTWVLRNTGQASLVVAGLITDRPYDVFAFWTGSAVAIELSTAWTSATVRADALARQNGVLVRSGTPTRRLVGTIRPLAAAQLGDTRAQRRVSNLQNRVLRFMDRIDTTDTWTYGTAAFRQANAAAANQLDWVASTPDVLVSIRVHGLVLCSGAAVVGASGVGIDSTTVNSAQTRGAAVPTGGTAFLSLAEYKGYPGLGGHLGAWLEYGGANVTFVGDGGVPIPYQAGMVGEISA